MKKLIKLLVLLCIAAVVYSIFSNPQKKEQFMRAIDESTGLDLQSEGARRIQRSAGAAAEKLLRYLGDTLTDPAFYQALERWGKGALNTLSESELELLKNDLEAEADKPKADYEAVLEEYLGTNPNI